MKLTKLRIVQMVLSAIDSDDVTSISDTVESEQVGVIVDTVYDDINGEYPWAHLRELGKLEVTPTPNKMKIPEHIMTVNNVYYKKKLLQYILPEEMLSIIGGRDTTLDNVDDTGAVTDQDPTYWSSMDDTYIVFDSYDISLVASLSDTDVYRMPNQMTSGSEYPDLPERFHNILFQGATADAFYNLKGDTTGFNIYRNRYKKSKEKMDRWAKRINRKVSTGINVNYGRKGI